MEALILYLLKTYGPVGVLLILNGFLIWDRIKDKSKDKDGDENKLLSQKVDQILRELTEIKGEVSSIHEKSSEAFISHEQHELISSKTNEIVEKINLLVNKISNHQSISDGKIDELNSLVKEELDALMITDISKLNQERVDELKAILKEYNKTMLDLTVALERLKGALSSKE